jgi:hypothetical protein
MNLVISPSQCFRAAPEPLIRTFQFTYVISTSPSSHQLFLRPGGMALDICDKHVSVVASTLPPTRWNGSRYRNLYFSAPQTSFYKQRGRVCHQLSFYQSHLLLEGNSEDNRRLRRVEDVTALSCCWFEIVSRCLFFLVCFLVRCHSSCTDHSST